MDAKTQGVLDLIEIYRKHFEALEQQGLKTIDTAYVISEFKTLEKVIAK